MVAELGLGALRLKVVELEEGGIGVSMCSDCVVAP